LAPTTKGGKKSKTTKKSSKSIYEKGQLQMEDYYNIQAHEEQQQQQVMETINGLREEDLTLTPQ